LAHSGYQKAPFSSRTEEGYLGSLPDRDPRERREKSTGETTEGEKDQRIKTILLKTVPGVEIFAFPSQQQGIVGLKSKPESRIGGQEGGTYTIRPLQNIGRPHVDLLFPKKTRRLLDACSSERKIQTKTATEPTKRKHPVIHSPYFRVIEDSERILPLSGRPVKKRNNRPRNWELRKNHSVQPDPTG